MCRVSAPFAWSGVVLAGTVAVAEVIAGEVAGIGVVTGIEAECVEVGLPVRRGNALQPARSSRRLKPLKNR
jgi:hypothetical protein